MGLGANVVQIQAAGSRANQLHAVLVQIPCVHATRAAHGFGHQAALTAGRGTGVQHLHTGLDLHRQRGQHGAFSLNGKDSLAIALVGGEPARAGHAVRARHDAPLPVKMLIAEPRLKLRAAHAQTVGAYGFAAAIRRPGDDLLGEFRAIGRRQTLHQRQRHGISFGNILLGLGFPVGQGERARVPIANQAAQHGVYQRGHTLPTRPAGLLHRLVHSGMIGDSVHEQDLRRREGQNIHDLRIRAALHPGGNQALYAQPVFQREIEHAGGQAAILLAELGGVQLAIQRLRSVGVVAEHILERLQRHIAGGRALGNVLFRGGPLRGSVAAAKGLLLRAIARTGPRAASGRAFAPVEILLLLSTLLIHPAHALPQLNLVPVSIFLPCR